MSVNVNDVYFDGYYKQIWKAIIPEELTVKETDFIFSFFQLNKGSKVLDLMCGYGRHALALARKGIEVTAVDNLADYITELKLNAEKEGLPVNALQYNVTTFSPGDKYDLVICMGNSLNFFDEADTVQILSAAAACLKPGGHLLLNSWSVAEIAFKNFKDKSWSEIDGLKFLTDSKLLFHPTRIETESTIIASDGATEIKKGIDYIFSINEIEAMINKSGLQLKELYSIPGRKKFSIGEPRIYLVAQKP
jgi:2-polyprenyl-3-methyl-5-hydroxy-6-metoxy-1,4-benzoquinol methylase